MSTTQRSKNMNSFFDGYVDATTPLKKFVGDYDNALARMVENEKIADFGSFQRKIPCITIHAIEKQLQEVYTNAKFKEKVMQLPSKYILDCWRKDLKRKYTIIQSSYDDLGDNHEAQRFNDLCNDHCEIALLTSKDHETHIKWKNHMRKFKDKELSQNSTRSEYVVSHDSPSETK
ncbi:protein FAR1-RELATED SEQUENCE 5-like [Carya illinoinensis]|uniref:protein FAR1-RELATED SEQUENCE 5-like n=1 Tax=Carya illinoinensis TaxID=32201 RepID=UPI001C721F19|nr:protein FAR1-RELATED SEQUENCE 5-like [Carya illinoinensis]